MNARSSGVSNPHRTAEDLAARLAGLGAAASAAVTGSERELWSVLRAEAGSGRRVVLVGGDGTVHAAANAPLDALPEVAIVPVGRANNIARALGIPLDPAGALHTAAQAPARPLDALHVRTPERTLYALEAVSAGFQAAARHGYRGDNSADLRQGVRVLAAAVRRHRPYDVRVRADGAELRSRVAAQLFVSNLRYFGFGFDVNPDGDPADGRAEVILMEAAGRRTLLTLLAATYRGRHLARAGVRRVGAQRVELSTPLPIVADAIPLGTTTATVIVVPARLHVAAPDGGAP